MVEKYQTSINKYIDIYKHTDPNRGLITFVLKF